MFTSRPIAALVLALLPVAVPAVPTGAAERQGLVLHESLARDPLLALGTRLEHPGAQFRGLFETVRRFTSDPAGEGSGYLPSLSDEQLEMLTADLLPAIGPEIVLSVDLPPLDEALATLHLPQGDPFAAFLGRIGMLGQVSDPQRVERALPELIRSLGGEIVRSAELTRATLPPPLAVADPAAVPPALALFWAVRGERLALGFSEEWVRAALEPRRKGQRLTDGEDFKRVFARLDPRPHDLIYVNLPKLRDYINGSQVVQLVLQGNVELREFTRRFFTREAMGIGLGTTSVRSEAGVRTTHFGPPWMSGAAVSGGFVAALALPNLMAAMDRGKSRQTLDDIEAIARACEGFSSDSRNYPGPTEGWVPVEHIAAYLEPIYIGQLPRTDRWENPIFYWSDGGSYRILSMGRDGRVDRDWTVPLAPEAVASPDSDIVFGDGRLLSWPGGTDSE